MAMHYHLSFPLMLIFVLCNFYCYSSPISYTDQNEQEQIMTPAYVDEPILIKASMKNHETNADYWKILCVLYDDCYSKERQDYVRAAIKPKRLTSNLFHGIPKFGKRAFTSAFSGIPKFG
ncbi:unnamed protein product [Adineta ricciae]|uniref:Uncharacterized protein n=1 Tax=Adineta ricciae TaxID=249248 RepID=A0A814CCR8_ADIRI|nr:unnamed protein product [Adineta ricciae]